jgi:formate dehydrogenase subunit delta
MSVRQIEHLVKMANQIALNLTAGGDKEAEAKRVWEHIEKFWTPAMREELLSYWQQGGEGVSPEVSRALFSQTKPMQTIGS